jgi:hypothetical protein
MFHFAIEPWNRTVLRMLAGVEIAEDEVHGMLLGRVPVADIPPGPREAEFVDLLDRYRQRLPGAV